MARLMFFTSQRYRCSMPTRKIEGKQVTFFTIPSDFPGTLFFCKRVASAQYNLFLLHPISRSTSVDWKLITLMWLNYQYISHDTIIISTLCLLEGKRKSRKNQYLCCAIVYKKYIFFLLLIYPCCLQEETDDSTSSYSLAFKLQQGKTQKTLALFFATKYVWWKCKHSLPKYMAKWEANTIQMCMTVDYHIDKDESLHCYVCHQTCLS